MSCQQNPHVAYNTCNNKKVKRREILKQLEKKIKFGNGQQCIYALQTSRARQIRFVYKSNNALKLPNILPYINTIEY